MSASDLYNTVVHHKTFRTEGTGRSYDDKDTAHLLHGLIHVKIIRAKNLRNMDGRLCGLNMCVSNKSDPYVTLYAADHRFVKTRTINNELDPIWREDTYTPVGHYMREMTFEVKDRDFGRFMDLIGTTTLDVRDLLKEDRDGNQLRVGIHKIATLDGKISHGRLEYFIEYIPAAMLCRTLEVPGVYFNEQKGDIVTLYVNSDDGDDIGTPQVTYGGPSDNEKVWKPPRLWKDIFHAICDAQHFIYIVGWAIDCTQSLLRGKEREEAEAQGKYSSVFGELLSQKAEEGVKVNMLVWDDASSTFGLSGMMGTHDEATKAFFRNTKVTLRLAPMLGGRSNTFMEKAEKLTIFTHHQKSVVLDAKSETGEGRELLAFMGGIDLTDGRWDNRKHPLFRTLTSDHKGDAYNGCFNVDVARVGPRQPWHDIHLSFRGPGVMDLIENFVERWHKQASDSIDELIDLNSIGFELPNVDSSEEWHNQLFRSIDDRTAIFRKSHLATFLDVDVDDIPDVSFQGDDFRKPSIHGSTKSSKLARKAKAKAGEKIDKVKDRLRSNDRSRTFVKSDTNGFLFSRDLELKKGRNIDSSAHAGMVHHIRRAEHTIYIESQYFLGSAHLWRKCNTVKCDNLIPSEITLKICQKIEAGERFTAYILIPMWSEGIPESGAVQAILHWQLLTMEGMYVRIAAALNRRNDKLGDVEDGVTPQDYLNFYCLGTRETLDGSESTNPPKPGTREATLSKTRRSLIYVHSKLLIIDDAVALVGSSNINQRSLDGSRDSEILLASWQPAHLASRESIPRGDVHAFRMHCWATTTGKMEDVYRQPSSLSCVRTVNEIAEENWKTFIGDDITEMDSHLLPYPISVGSDGSVSARSDLDGGCFPDTKANVAGARSAMLPEILTT